MANLSYSPHLRGKPGNPRTGSMFNATLGAINSEDARHQGSAGAAYLKSLHDIWVIMNRLQKQQKSNRRWHIAGSG